MFQPMVVIKSLVWFQDEGLSFMALSDNLHELRVTERRPAFSGRVNLRGVLKLDVLEALCDYASLCKVSPKGYNASLRIAHSKEKQTA